MAQSTAVAVYSKPNCPQCTATKQRLDRNGTAYTLVDVTTEPVALQYVRDLGYQQVPVVVLDTGAHWSGYRPDHLDTLKEN